MTGFTKLVPEIVMSSIWNEPPEIRCVWIAMIATKDQHGNVRGNRRAIARMANVTVESVDKALELFQQPDPDSENPELNGRRIEAVPGGWHIVSHSKYRVKDYREYEAERKREYRKKKTSRTCPGHVPDSSASVSASVSASESLKGDCQGEAPKPSKKTYGSEFRNVRLTKQEYGRLIEKCGGEDMRQRVIDKLDVFLESKPKKYKSHYAAILNWVIRAVKEDDSKGAAQFKPLTANERMNMTKEQQSEYYRTGVKRMVSPAFEPSDTEFDLFWQAWPEAKRKAEGAARREFAEATTKPPIKELIAEIELQKKSEEWTKEGGRYIPSPVNWLKDGRWTDIVTVNRR